MKSILIIYPHWVPSNLAGVHRARLIANFLQKLGWHPILLTVSEEFYEEEPDTTIFGTASDDIEVIKTKAYHVTKPRLIGDIGLRAFSYLFSEAMKLISSRKIDFIWIPIPSFYTALLGRILFEKTNTPYGIDYIDPWVRDISNRKNLRSRLSLLTAKILEPIAVRKASLISGVSTAYYQPVLERNFKHRKIEHVGMPYGFDPNDHEIKLQHIEYPWSEEGDVLPIVYAGAFLPNSHLFVKALFKSLKTKLESGAWDKRKQFYFLGTGNYTGTSISEYAKHYGVEEMVHEQRDRYPYLHVLNFLGASHAVMVIGSTEKHYTASKTFQSLLSRKPVFAVFHRESSAVKVLQECEADALLVEYENCMPETELEIQIEKKLEALSKQSFRWNPKLNELGKYSARASAQALVDKLNELV